MSERLEKLRPSRLPARAGWAVDLPMHMPQNLAACLSDADGIWDEQTMRQLAREAATDLRGRAAYTDNPPVTSRLPMNYRKIPGPLRRLLANGIGRLQRARQSRWSRFPGWPIDLSADLLGDLGGLDMPRFSPTPVLLTHDIDSEEGLINLVDLFLDVEEASGARSANYMVPCAWPLDHGRIAESVARGHEVGVHGYNHANQTPFLPAEQRKPRLTAGRAFGGRYGAVGYRAPSLLRTAALLSDLDELYDYDSSIPTSGGPFPVPNNGCASARPWKIGRLWEIPLTLPRDGSLRFLGHSSCQIGAMWRSAAETVSASGGIVSLLTHCEACFSGNLPMLRAYREFLEWVAGDARFKFMRPRDLLEGLQTQGARHDG